MGYQFQRRNTHRRRHMGTVIIIVLAVVTAGSVAALFLRGFKVQNLTDQLKNKELQTPAMEVCLIETKGYESKMAAYQAGIAAKDGGFGVYVLPDVNSQWTWVAGVYANEKDANDTLSQNVLPADAKVEKYQIVGKKFKVDPAALEPCQQVLTTVQNVYNLLFELRMAVMENNEIKDLQLALTTLYNQIKNNTETLQTLNDKLQSQIIASLIYTANQNILGLQDIIYADTVYALSLATVNTALLMTIFSLDNFSLFC